MVEKFARLLVQRSVSWTVVVITVLLTVAAIVLSGTVEQDDDLLAFLPKTDPDIAAFQEINNTFGGTDIAMVGISTDNVFDTAFLTKLRDTTKSLGDVGGLDQVLSLTSVPDFREDPNTGGIETSSLVQTIPTTEAEMAELKDRVMRREHIVGTFISEDADAVLLLGFVSKGMQPRPIANEIREIVGQNFEADQIYWGGGPFLSTWIFETTQRDMDKLTPWAVVVILVIMMLAFRDFIGTILGLTATVMGILVSRASMAVLDVKFNVVLGSMPVILFAVGSAYAIHILSHYYEHARKVGAGPEAVVLTLKGTGTTVLAAGLTTVAGLLSFIAMDIEPMQTFGLFTAIGIFVALIASLTFVPAVIALFPRPAKEVTEGPLKPIMRKLVTFARVQRVPTLLFVGMLFATGMTYALNVDTRMDLAAFFEKGSEPQEAQAFLDEKFGGSQFVTIRVEGDLTSPEVLREIGRVSDEVMLVPHVSSVAGVPGIISLVNSAMSDAERVPDTTGQVKVLYRFMSGDASLSRLMNETRDDTLLQIRVDSAKADDLDMVLAEVERIVAESAATSFVSRKAASSPEGARERLGSLTRARILALSKQFGVAMPVDSQSGIDAVIQGPVAVVDASSLQQELSDFLQSDESFVPLTAPQAEAVATRVSEAPMTMSGWDLEPMVAEALVTEPSDAVVQDLLVVLDGPRQDIYRKLAGLSKAGEVIQRLDLAVPEGPRGERYVELVGASMEVLSAPSYLSSEVEEGAEAKAISWTVNGMPVLYRGLSRSVTKNQFKSLGMAIGLVLIIMTLLYRSVATGVLAAAPTILTLAIVYGGMGFMGVQLDIGTSMLASIIIGAGVDYAVHFLAAWEVHKNEPYVQGAIRAVQETSHAIWTNAVMVAAGFFVLTLGQAKPLQNVGGLTSMAMIAAAFSTFIVIPLFAKKTRYRREA